MDDIINQKFNRLLVLSYKGKTKNTYKRGFTHYYLCRCDCGEETTVDRGSLRYGSIKSCGCLTGEYQREKMRIENDLSGKIFGRLTVLGRKADNFKKFECLCECGNITFVGSNDLKTSHTRSCGCLLKEVSSKRLHEYKMSYRESLGKDPLEPLGRAEDLERDQFRLEMQQKSSKETIFLACGALLRAITYMYTTYRLGSLAQKEDLILLML